MKGSLDGAAVAVPERKDLDLAEKYIFPKGSCYNYMQPHFDVTENIGPKFNFSR